MRKTIYFLLVAVLVVFATYLFLKIGITNNAAFVAFEICQFLIVIFTIKASNIKSKTKTNYIYYPKSIQS